MRLIANAHGQMACSMNFTTQPSTGSKWRPDVSARHALLAERALEEFQVFGAEPLREKKIDIGFFECGAKLEHQIEFRLVQVVTELRKGAGQVMPGERPKIRIAHCLLRQFTQQIHAHAVRNIHANPHLPHLNPAAVRRRFSANPGVSLSAMIVQATRRIGRVEITPLASSIRVAGIESARTRCPWPPRIDPLRAG